MTISTKPEHVKKVNKITRRNGKATASKPRRQSETDQNREDENTRDDECTAGRRVPEHQATQYSTSMRKRLRRSSELSFGKEKTRGQR